MYERAAKYCKELLNCQYPYVNLRVSAILGYIEVETGNVENGLGLLLDTLEKAIQGNFQDVVSGIYFHIAHVYEKKNNLEKSAEYLEQSRNVQRNINQSLGIHNIEADYFISMSLGRAYVRLKRHENSIQCWEKCIEIDREMSLFGRLAYCLKELGCSQCLVGDFDSAYKTLYESLTLIRENEIREEGAERATFAWLALASWNNGKYEEALEYYFEHNISSRREEKEPYPFLQIEESDLQPDADVVEFYENGVFVLVVPKQYSLQELMQSSIANLVKRRPDLRREADSLELLLFKKPVAQGFGKSRIFPNQKCSCGSGKKYKKCCGKN